MHQDWPQLLADTSLHPLTHEEPSLFICPLTDHGVITLTGEESKTYLMGQITADISQLTDDQHCLTAHCDAKGKMWSISWVLRQNDEYFLINSEHEHQASLQALQKYGVFAKTQISDANQAWCIFAIGGTTSNTFIKQHTLPAISLNGSLEGNHLLLLNHQQAQQLIIEHKDHLYQPEQWQKTKIIAGVPHLDERSINQYVPQMLNLQALAAISFTKGCYTGQEMVARMKYLGKNKRATYIVKGQASHPVQSGDELQQAVGEHWRRAGTIINIAGEPQHFYALVVMASELDDDCRWRVKDDPQSEVHLLPLPYSLNVEDS